MINLLQIPLAPEGGLKGFGPLGLEGGENAGFTFNKFISSSIGIITVIALIWFIFLFIGGTIGVMNAGGDKNALESSKKKITNGVLGLVMVVAGIFIIDLIGNIIGIPEILNPADLIYRITR